MDNITCYTSRCKSPWAVIITSVVVRLTTDRATGFPTLISNTVQSLLVYSLSLASSEIFFSHHPKKVQCLIALFLSYTNKAYITHKQIVVYERIRLPPEMPYLAVATQQARLGEVKTSPWEDAAGGSGPDACPAPRPAHRTL